MFIPMKAAIVTILFIIGYPVALVVIARFVPVIRERRRGWFAAHEAAVSAIVLGWATRADWLAVAVNAAWLVTAAVWWTRTRPRLATERRPRREVRVDRARPDPETAPSAGGVDARRRSCLGRSVDGRLASRHGRFARGDRRGTPAHEPAHRAPRPWGFGRWLLVGAPGAATPVVAIGTTAPMKGRFAAGHRQVLAALGIRDHCAPRRLQNPLPRSRCASGCAGGRDGHRLTQPAQDTGQGYLADAARSWPPRPRDLCRARRAPGNVDLAHASSVIIRGGAAESGRQRT